MNERDYIGIEAYLSGELSPPEQRAFDVRLAAEPELAAALIRRRQLHEHLRADAGETELRANLTQLGKQFFPNQKETATVLQLRPARRWWLSGIAAAAIALLVFIGGRFLLPETATTYEQFALHQPLSLTERGTLTDAGAAESAYNEGRYGEAIGLLQAYLLQQAEDRRAKLALGVAFLENNQDEEAISIFTAIADGGSSLAPYGTWYLALSAVKRGDAEAALKYLDGIPEGDAFLSEKVAKLRATL